MGQPSEQPTSNASTADVQAKVAKAPQAVGKRSLSSLPLETSIIIESHTVGSILLLVGKQ